MLDTRPNQGGDGEQTEGPRAVNREASGGGRPAISGNDHEVARADERREGDRGFEGVAILPDQKRDDQQPEDGVACAQAADERDALLVVDGQAVRFGERAWGRERARAEAEE